MINSNEVWIQSAENELKRLQFLRIYSQFIIVNFDKYERIKLLHIHELAKDGTKGKFSEGPISINFRILTIMHATMKIK